MRKTSCSFFTLKDNPFALSLYLILTCQPPKLRQTHDSSNRITYKFMGFLAVWSDNNLELAAKVIRISHPIPSIVNLSAGKTCKVIKLGYHINKDLSKSEVNWWLRALITWSIVSRPQSHCRFSCHIRTFICTLCQ